MSWERVMVLRQKTSLSLDDINTLRYSLPLCLLYCSHYRCTYTYFFFFYKSQNRKGRIGANWKVLPLNHPCKQILSHYTKGNSHEGIITASKDLSNMNLSWEVVKNAQNNWNIKLLANEIRLTWVKSSRSWTWQKLCIPGFHF